MRTRNSTKVFREKLYTIRVPMVATYSEEEMDLFGIPQDETENEYEEMVQKDVSLELVTIMTTIDKMIDMFSLGYPIRLMGNHVTEVFKIMETYLSGRNDDEHFSLNRLTTPDTRLKEIDAFASGMFDLNKMRIVKDTTNARNGFDLSIDRMTAGFDGLTTQTRNPLKQNKTRGILASYQDNSLDLVQEETDITRSYLINRQPEINMDKIIRESPLRHRKGQSFQDIKQGKE